MSSNELRHKLISAIETNPEFSQRELAQHLGISLGKANYCLRALIRQGLIKVRNFRNSSNRKAYMYLLTPSGIEEKSQLTLKYLNLKIEEYESLRIEIEQLRKAVGSDRNL